MDCKLILILFPTIVFLCMAMAKLHTNHKEEVNISSDIERVHGDLSGELKRIKRLIPGFTLISCFPPRTVVSVLKYLFVNNTESESIKTSENKKVKRNVPDLFELDNFNGDINNEIKHEKRFAPIIALGIILSTTLSAAAGIALTDEIEKRKEIEENLETLKAELKNDELNRTKLIEDILKTIKSEENNNNNTRLKRDLKTNEEFISVEQFLNKVNTSFDEHLVIKRMTPLSPLVSMLTPQATNILSKTAIGAIAVSAMLFVKETIYEHFAENGNASEHRNMLNKSMKNLERAIALIDLSDGERQFQRHNREKRNLPIFPVKDILRMYSQNKENLTEEFIKCFNDTINGNYNYQHHHISKRFAVPAAAVIARWTALTVATTVLSSAVFSGVNFAFNAYEDDVRAKRYDDMVDRIQKRLNDTCLLYNYGKFFFFCFFYFFLCKINFFISKNRLCKRKLLSNVRL